MKRARVWSDKVWDGTDQSYVRVWRYAVPLPHGGAATGVTTSWRVAMWRARITVDLRWSL